MKYFAVSDIHSFADDLKFSLSTAGFNKRDKNHTLIVLGDIFDRGDETIAVYKFLKSIPKSRRILIRGNHELLYLDLLKKKHPQQHDFSNNTVYTFVQIAGYGKAEETFLRNSYYYHSGTFSDTEAMSSDGQKLWNEIKEKVENHEITKWLRSKEWLNYFELGKYIFVHSFIPLKDNDGLPFYYVENRKFEYIPDWRDIPAESYKWEDATWGCPYRNYKAGLFDAEKANGKVLICGHWTTRDFFEQLSGWHIKQYYHTIYYSENLIALDGGVFRDLDLNLFHPQNVLVFDSEDLDTCYDETGRRLEYVH